MFSKVMGYECGTKNEENHKELVKNDFLKTSTLLNKAKKTVRDTDWHLKRLSEKVLPRCQSADITFDRVKRYEDVPLKTKRKFDPSLIKKSSENKNIEQSKSFISPKSKHQEKYVNVVKSPKNVPIANYSTQQPSYASSSVLPKLIEEERKSNISIVNLNFKTSAVSDKNVISDCKFKNLTVLQNPSIDVKPDLVTRKLADIQIKSDNKKPLCNCKSNVAYHEFTYESDVETCCKCQSLIQPKITNDKVEARKEICKVLCEMLDNKSNESLDDQLISQLEKIKAMLEETKPMEYDDLNELENFVEEHSVVGFSKTAIKNKLFEIAKHLFEETDDGISFDQMATEIENNAHQVLKRIDKIKYSILTMNPSIECPVLSNTLKESGNVTLCAKKITNRYPNNTINTKNIQADKNVSVRELLRCCSNSFSSPKMFKSATVLKEFDSQTTLPSKTKDYINKNPNKCNNLTTQTAVNYKTNTPELKKYQLESEHVDQSETTSLGDYEIISNKHLVNHSSLELKSQLKPFEEYLNSDQRNDFTINENDWEADNNLKINVRVDTDSCTTDNEIELMRCDMLNNREKNENVLNNNKNIGHPLINSQIQDLTSNIEEWQFNSLLFTPIPSKSDQHSDLCTPIINKEITEDSTTNTNSIISSTISAKQSSQDVQSEAESLISLGEVNHIDKFHYIYSDSSAGEIKNNYLL